MAYFNPIGTLVPVIIERLQDEYKAHQFYRNLANWCEITGFTKAAAFFSAEAESELTHALKLQQYLNDWNVQYSMPSVATTVNVNTLSQCVNDAYGIEVALYEKYQENAVTALGVDISAFNLLSGMVQIQYEAVSEYLTLIDKLALTNDMLIYEDAAFG
jgi:ferritin